MPRAYSQRLGDSVTQLSNQGSGPVLVISPAYTQRRLSNESELAASAARHSSKKLAGFSWQRWPAIGSMGVGPKPPPYGSRPYPA